MDKIIQILNRQKNELDNKLKEKYVERDVKLKYLDVDIIKVIIGPRRAGKSFFVIHTLNKFGKYIYINFDDESLVEINNINKIIESAFYVYGKTKTIFIDEIQNYPKWEIVVNRLQREGFNLIVSGSNSNLLSSELATHLTGRHFPVYVFPFNFTEYYSVKKDKEKNEEFIFYEYIMTGGYPEIVMKSIEAYDYLKLLFDSILYKDIIKRHKIRKDNSIVNIANHLISNISTEFSYRTLTNISDAKNPTTINKYLSYLENAFLIFKLPKFSYKSKEILSSPGKVFCYDNGFIKTKSLSSSSDFGKMFENAIAVKLMQEKQKGDITFYYWHSIDRKSDVDFVVVNKKGEKILIQVCSDLSDAKRRDREIRALINAGDKLKCNELYILNKNIEMNESHEWFGKKCKIKFLPAWKWIMYDKNYLNI